MNLISQIMDKIFHPQAASGASPAQPSPVAPSPAKEPVDVEKVLSEMSKNQKQKLNWESSIVDLLKMLNMDSSLAARTQLAHELNYSGNTSDTAAMNTWLHAQVMQKLAENGGKIPDSMKH